MAAAIKDKANRYKNLVGGKWEESSSGKYIDISSPVDNKSIGKVPAMTREDVDRVMATAKAAVERWRLVPESERAAILDKCADLLLENIDELTELLVHEIGKDKKSAKSEIKRSADFIKFTTDCGRSMSGESLTGDRFPGFKSNKISIVKREPLGVVLAISPFNYPVNLAVSKIAPALIIGNSVVLKPATQGAISALHMVKIFEEAGVPAGVLNTVTGRGSEIGDYITTHKSVDFINFTGSTDVGRHISKITEMVPLLLELGGKDAAIVLDDADLELTAKEIVEGAFSYSGQRCTALKRVLVMEKVADELVEKIKRRMGKLKVGSPLKSDEVDIVPLIDTKSADFVMGLIEDAVKKGAVTVTGGKRLEGNLIEPTLFDYVTEDMRIAWEEPFGPVVPVLRVKSKDDAIRIANESQYGLQSSVFSKSINDVFDIADRLEVGTVQINDKTQRGPDHFPFLGVKSSGMGTQGIKYSILSMSRPKAVILNLKEDSESGEPE